MAEGRNWHDCKVAAAGRVVVTDVAADTGEDTGLHKTENSSSPRLQDAGCTLEGRDASFGLRGWNE